MKWTNKKNLPAPVVLAVQEQSESHDSKADISVTGLIRPPQMRVLEKRYWKDVTRDISDSIWALFGSLLHGFLGKFQDEGAIVEQRFFCNILGWKVSGQPDLYWKKDCVIEDYKFTSVYSYQKGKVEWEQQMNCYAHLVRLAGYEVKGLKIRAFLRDHMDSKVFPGGDYPEDKCMAMDLPLWDDATAKEFMELRVRFHQEAETRPDEDLPNCTPEEMWEKPEAWAVKKKGAEKALKVIRIPGQAGNDAANLLAKAKGPEYFVEHRVGERRRCENYCDAGRTGKCHQFEQYKAVAWNKNDKTQTHERGDI